MHSTRYARQRPRWIQARYTVSFVSGSTTLGKAAVITMATHDGILRTSRAVPKPSTDRALRSLPSEVERDPMRSSRYGRHCLPVSDQDASRSDHAISFDFCVTTLGKAAIITMATADSALRTSRAVPHPNINRALCCLNSEVERDPVHSTRLAVSEKDAYRSVYTISFAFGSTSLG